MGGAALATACIVAAAVALVRVLRTAVRRARTGTERPPAPDGPWRGVLEQTAARAGADAAALRLAHVSDTVSLSEGEAAVLLPELGAGAPGGPRYLRYRDAAGGNGRPGSVRSALVLPLAGGGAVAAYWRRELSSPPEHALPVLRELARVVGGPATVVTPPGEVRRLRALATLAATLDLEELARRLVEVVVEDHGADAAAVGVRPEPAEALVVETLHLSDAETRWLGATLEAETVVASITRYVEADAVAAAAERPIGTMIVVPLGEHHGVHAGNLAAVWRRDIAGTADRRLAELERVVADLQDVLENVLRVRRLERTSAGTSEPDAVEPPPELHSEV